MRRHLGAGYTMVKMKVGGLPLDEDVRRLEAVLEVVGSGERLAVDANCKFDRTEALRYARALAPFKLRWFEEPCDPLDFELFAELAKSYAPPLATGENLHSTQDVDNLVRFGGLRPAAATSSSIDPPQAYGIVQYARTLDMLDAPRLAAQRHVPARRQPDVAAIAAGFGLGGAESYPGVFGGVRRICRRRPYRSRHDLAA